MKLNKLKKVAVISMMALSQASFLGQAFAGGGDSASSQGDSCQMDLTDDVAKAAEPFISEEWMKMAYEYYKKPYRDAPYDSASRWVNGQNITVNRPIHALPHAARKAAISNDIVALLSNESDGPMGNWMRENLKREPQFGKQLALASLMLRSGRESEVDGTNDPVRYEEYVYRGAQFFENEAEKYKLFKTKEELNDFVLGIKSMAGGQKLPLNQHQIYLHDFFRAVHNLDLRRIGKASYTPSSVQGGLAKYLRLNPSDPIVQKLWDRAGKYLQASGDRDKHAGRPHRSDRFFTHANDPMLLLKALDEVYQKPVTEKKGHPPEPLSMIDEKFDSKFPGCGGPLHQSARDLASTDFNYTNGDIHKTLESFSASNIQRMKSELGSLTEEEQNLYTKVMSFSPPVTYRMSGTNFTDMMKDPTPEIRSSRYSNRKTSFSVEAEDFIFGSFGCVFASLGPVDGISKYGDVLIRLKRKSNLRSWGSEITGYTHVHRHLNSSVYSIQAQGPEEVKKTRLDFAKGIYTQGDYNPALALMLIKSLRTGVAPTRNKISDPEQLKKNLLQASTSKEFWDLAYGDPESRNAAAYLEIKMPGRISFDEIEQVFVPDHIYHQNEALFSKYSGKILPLSQKTSE